MEKLANITRNIWPTVLLVLLCAYFSYNISRNINATIFITAGALVIKFIFGLRYLERAEKEAEENVILSLEVKIKTSIKNFLALALIIGCYFLFEVPEDFVYAIYLVLIWISLHMIYIWSDEFRKKLFGNHRSKKSTSEVVVITILFVLFMIMVIYFLQTAYYRFFD